MTYLDISPILVALREQPDTFSLSEGWIIHLPSRHRFQVQAGGSVTLEAAYGDAGLSVHAQQGRQLHQAVASWRAEYWIPREISRHFGYPCRRASLGQRWRRKVADLLAQHQHDGALAIYAKAWADIGLVRGPRNNEPPPSRPTKPSRPSPTNPSANVRPEEATV